MKKPLYDRPMTNLERQHRFQDQNHSIDVAFEEAYTKINWERRNNASCSLINFIEAYFIGLMVDTSPSEKMKEAINEMSFALSQSRPYNIELPRGSGKTSVVEMAAIYLLATGQKKFCVIISNNARSAGNILKDIARPILEKDTAFTNDFPEICLPYQICNGSFRRKQLYKGRDTEIEKNASILRFPTIYIDGEEVPSSGAVITVRGITSGIRGLKVGKLRPDCVILDDLQSAESASNQEQVEKILDIIKRDILNLSSNGKLTVMMTSTPICPEDLCERIENDVSWKTTKYPAIIKFPTDITKHGDNGLWAKYFKMYDVENAEDKTHSESLQFYKDNQSKMDDGAELFAPERFKVEDGHISGLQALLERRHLIGDSAFQAEMQMKPKKFSFKLDITPKDVLQKISSSPQYIVPDGYTYVVASTDLNVSYALTTVIVGFKRDMTAHIIHYFIKKCHIDIKQPQANYNTDVYNALSELGEELKNLGVKIDGWGIDASGNPFDAVALFSKHSMQIYGIPSIAMSGKASHMFNPYIRSRLRDAINNTVLCGDAQEHIKNGAGKKYIFWNSDYYRESVQRAMLAKIGSIGGCSLFHGDSEEHTIFASQLCNERLLMIQYKKDGRDIYTWKTKEPHDFLDAMAQAYAVAASQGISGNNIKSSMDSLKKIPHRMIIKPRIKIV